ncbi:hypothetical protein J0895_16350 [Phormidium pseudopriestleyi FRX01]|uniref:Uncharacterized protein n=1 Tax=Phormidium pseudopriestleyi FRX01 TaxID=1759528 RepID=A0ABS3FUA5_9CYAN|nr:hypothetical protein [Phormidium pseudopriestleyi]MBO0350638.1 hypothetical protein [Phormidium pseudopriestleyi FRX01]
MKLPRLRQILLSSCLGLLLLVSACGEVQEPSRWDGTQQQSTEVSASGQPVPGSSFNRLFPSNSGGYSLVYTQEKEGFAEAKLQQGSQDMAMLSISDTVTNPSAVQKFQQSNTQVGGYPSSSLTPNDTAILVGDRFQVKIQSRNPAFSASDREAWLQRFNLNGLKQLK